MAEKKLDLEKVAVLEGGDSVILGGSIAATDKNASETGESEARYYMKMKYQEMQFLRAKDFKDEQAYHARKLRDHNKQLHVHGICEGGLEVSKSVKYNGCVNVSAGSAIDINGNSMMLASSEIVDLASACVQGEIYTSPIKLYMRYAEADASDPKYNVKEGGFSGCTRTLEKPEFYVSPMKDKDGKDILNEEHLLLAIIERTSNGTITNVNTKPDGRRLAGNR